MNQRFTLDGSEALERRLATTCEAVRAGVQRIVPRPRLDGILLGGGYGRGEGGVLRTESGDQPYNDLEFYVFVRGPAVLAEHQFRHPLHELSERLSPEAGLEVEFKVLTLEKLRRSPPSMFYYDLVEGHRWIVGDESLLGGCSHHREAQRIPLCEATRLLFNRCSGLLFAKGRLEGLTFTSADADFVGRNQAKARLAFGDVLLTAHGEYHWSCRERQRRLLARGPFESILAWAEPLRPLHAAGVDFKLHPRRCDDSRDELALEQDALSEFGKKLWVWLESKRLGAEFRSPRAYAFCLADKCPETSPWRNRLVNLRTFGLAGIMCHRYPRERLFHALALLLWEPGLLEENQWLTKTQSELRTGAADLAGLIGAYGELWRRFN